MPSEEPINLGSGGAMKQMDKTHMAKVDMANLENILPSLKLT